MFDSDKTMPTKADTTNNTTSPKNIFKVSHSSNRQKQHNPESNASTNDNIMYQAIEPRYYLDSDVILTDHTRNELEESLAKIKFHKVIYEDWGFSEVDKLGRSSILNFYGKPGTGKTLAAEAFAGRLNLPIIQVGIAEIESKLMGETSKNIQKVFQDAHAQGAVLFFDEADTLLGKRLSSVTQGVDNEVNAMRSTMLIELEKFDGIVIFATNFAENYDEAFRSRISYHVEFNLPDLDTRQKLWSRMLVPKIPLAETREDIIQQCAELSAGFSGREIRTSMRLALPKALMTPEVSVQDSKLALEHLISAINSIKKAQKEVGKSVNANENRQRAVEKAQIAKNILGVKSSFSGIKDTSNNGTNIDSESAQKNDF
ncbi:MAG: ATP-binding protein [Psychrobacter sp.]|nr:ATP-binding protein [Psychrobacter sp.]